MLAATGLGLLKSGALAYGNVKDLSSALLIDMISRISCSNLFIKFLSVLVAGIPFVFLFALMYSHMTGTPMRKALLKFYAIIYQLPDAVVLGEDSPMAFIFSNAVFYLGVFSFAILLGVVSDEIKTISNEVRNGRFPVTQVDHTVILNWSEEVPSVLRQLALGKKYCNHPFYKKPVAVLANMPKAEMDQAITSKLDGLPLEVYTRSGFPGVLNDQKMVGVDKASSIIVMQPDSEEAGARINKPDSKESGARINKAILFHCTLAHMSTATMALGATLPIDARQNVVLQCPLVAFKFLEGCRHGHMYARLSSDDFIYRLNAMSSVQPGLMRVYCHLMCPSRHTLQMQLLPASHVGLTYAESRRVLENSIACGYCRGLTYQLDPCESEVMRDGDRLILINTELIEAEGKSSLAEAVKGKHELAAERAATWRAEDQSDMIKKPASPARIIVIHTDAAVITNFVGEYLPPNSEVAIISSTEIHGIPAYSNGSEFKVILAENPTARNVLIEAGLETVKTILIGGVHKLTPCDADALVSTYLIEIQNALMTTDRKDAPYVLAPKNNFNALSTVKAYLKSLRESAEARGFSPKKIISHMDLSNREDILAGGAVQWAANSAYGEAINKIIIIIIIVLHCRVLLQCAANSAYGEVIHKIIITITITITIIIITIAGCLCNVLLTQRTGRSSTSL
eukprot:gene6573-3225_t